MGAQKRDFDAVIDDRPCALDRQAGNNDHQGDAQHHHPTLALA